MKKRTRNVIITACVAVVVVAAVLVGVFVIRPMVTEKKIHVKDTDDYYHEEVPLTEIPWYILKRYTELAVALPASGEPKPSGRLTLPIDVHYYTSPDASGEPALTLAKGTEVAAFSASGEHYVTYIDIGYGYCCFPDYKKGWRYGIPFTTEDLSQGVGRDWENKADKYYVQTSELEAMAQAFWEANQDSPQIQATTENKGGKEGFVHWLVRLPDELMEESGYFDAPDYP
ncbi:MAG TPA: hypothetical protein H9679_05190 [Firmicutes bacterium]|nr:hypothetical protein [Bacillota bacterium]